MRVTRITTDPDPYEPYRIALGYRVGDLLFVSGQGGHDEAGRLAAGDFARQAEQAFANLERVLRAGGSSLANVVKVTIFLTDMAHFPTIVALRERFFTPPYPADTIVEVSGLALPDMLVEIEAVAVADEAREP
jgi:2-iminobutanoate/2-iminopropanoate deaminase